MFTMFYIPYLYIIKSRLLAKGRLLSFFLILVIPPIYIAVVLQSNFTYLHLAEALLGLLLIQNFYETGYIQNDTETIKREIYPTLRLNEKSLEYYERNKYKIYSCRLIIAIFLSITLLIITRFSFDTVVFLLVSYLLIPIFLIYNSIRNIGNLFLHFVLTTIKYSAIQLLFLSTASFKVFILSLFAYPILNFIDRAATPRFLKKISLNYKITEFRVIYYFLFFLFFGFFFLVNYINILEYALFVFYFVYRLTIKIGFLFKRYLN